MEIYRGDIFYVAKGKYQGSEQGGERPAVVVSNNSCNHFSDCVEIVYLTSQTKKPLPTHVDVVCRCLSTALCEQIYTVSKDRLKDFVRTCTADEMQRIDDALVISLGLDKETPSKEESVTESQNKCDTPIKTPSEEFVRLTAERDIFKKLYEELLERVTSS